MPVLRKAVGCVVFALSVAQSGQAQIYAGRSADGGVVLSNFRSAAADEVAVTSPLDERAENPVPVTPKLVPPSGSNVEPVANVIRRIAQATALSPDLIHAVIAVESGFDPRAVSHKGAMGLMQLMPATAQRFGVADPFDPAQNIAGGAAYLKSLLELFGGDLRLALAAYNAGEAAVIRAGYRIPPFAETRAYVPRVLARLRTPRIN